MLDRIPDSAAGLALVLAIAKPALSRQGLNVLEGKRDIALQPGQIEILIAGRDDEGRVDICRDQLQLPVRARRAAFD